MDQPAGPETAPATQLQRRLVAASLDGWSDDIVAFAWILDGALDREQLAAAVGRLVRRHESLRTTLTQRGGEPVQVIRRGWTPPIELLELHGRRRRELPGAIRRRARRPFDLRGGEPLTRVSLIGLGPRRHVLVLALHHAIADQSCGRILLADLLAAYDGGRVAGAPAQRPGSEPSAGEARRASPDARYELLVVSGAGLSRVLVDRLARAAGRHRATLGMALTAGALLALGPVAGGPIQAGILDANRRRPGDAERVGCVFRVLAIEVTPAGPGPTLHAVRDAMLGAYEGALPPPSRLDVSVNDIRDAVGPPPIARATGLTASPYPLALSSRTCVRRRYYVGSDVEFLLRRSGPDAGIAVDLVADGAAVSADALHHLAASYSRAIRALAVL